MTVQQGTSVQIFLIDGTPNGLKVIEKSNWTGKLVSCSRAQFASAKKRPEFGRTGVYVLLGYDEEEEFPIAYIGEGDPVLNRLESHDKAKDFWTEVIIFTSKDENLNKAHIQYLESRLIEIAKSAKRARLDNANAPAKPTLSEPDVADMETKLAEMRLLFSVIGVKVFEVTEVSAVEGGVSPNLLSIRSDAIVVATGADRPDGFVVFKGSKCLKREGQSFDERGRKIRKNLEGTGVLKSDGNYLVFTQDYSFNSPSLAAFVVLGRSANGRTEWQDSSGKTLKEIQELVDA